MIFFFLFCETTFFYYGHVFVVKCSSNFADQCLLNVRTSRRQVRVAGNNLEQWLEIQRMNSFAFSHLLLFLYRPFPKLVSSDQARSSSGIDISARGPLIDFLYGDYCYYSATTQPGHSIEPDISFRSLDEF